LLKVALDANKHVSIQAVYVFSGAPWKHMPTNTDTM